MRRAIIFFLAALLILPMAACGGGNDNQNVQSGSNAGITTEDNAPPEEPLEELPEQAAGLALGETAETDIIKLSLDRADLAIALGNGDDYAFLYYLMPREYQAKRDADNPFVAAKGHTLIALTVTISSLDRGGYIDLNHDFCDKVEYKGETYLTKLNWKLESEDGIKWERYNAGNVLLHAGETKTLRCYLDIPVEADNLSDDFKVIFNLPDSKGAINTFAYQVTEADRIAIKETQPIDLELQGSWIHKDFGFTFAVEKNPPVDGTFTTTDGNRGIYIIGDKTVKLFYVASNSSLTKRVVELDYLFEENKLTLMGKTGSGEKFNYTKQ